MKILRFLALSLVVAACGGKVAFDGLGDSGASASASSSSSSSSSSASSSSASSSSSSSGGACPEFPEIGGGCSNEGATCPVPHACCGQSAKCSSGAWHMGPLTCQQDCIPCGPELSCEGGTCVLFQRETFQGATCRDFACPGGAVTCGCAQPVCDEVKLQCTSASSPLVTCSCTAC